jgi:hydrogenase expression/formation protein HypC
MAIVNFGGITQEVNIDLIDKVKLGDYLLIHCGCAIEKLNQEDAQETIELLEEVANNLENGEG